MIKTKHTPFWVFLAFSAIDSRKGALTLVSSCLLFTAYCAPWAQLLGAAPNSLLAQLFIFDDWSWAGMMLPISLWYIASLVWVEKNQGWERRPAGFDG